MPRPEHYGSKLLWGEQDSSDATLGCTWSELARTKLNQVRELSPGLDTEHVGARSGDQDGTGERFPEPGADGGDDPHGCEWKLLKLP